MGKRLPIYLCEVVIHNRFYGRRFMFRNAQSILLFGLSVASVKMKALRPDDNVLYGIRLTAVNAEEFDEKDAIKQGYGGEWHDISAAFIRYPTQFRSRSKPIIGTVLAGEHQGKHVALFALTSISPYFPVESIRKSIIDQVPYCGIRWRYGKDYQEAEIYYQGESVQNDILQSLNRYRKVRRGWRVNGCKYVGFQNVASYLIQAEKALIQGETMDGLILLHKAMGEYQILFRRKIDDGTLLPVRFNELSNIIAPKANENILDRVDSVETRTLIKLLIKQLKRKE